MVSSSAGVAGLPLSLVSGRQAAAERGGGGEDHRRAERNGPRERQEPNVHRASGRPTGASATSARSMATRWATISTASATRLESRRLREHDKPAIRPAPAVRVTSYGDGPPPTFTFTLPARRPVAGGAPGHLVRGPTIGARPPGPVHVGGGRGRASPRVSAA